MQLTNELKAVETAFKIKQAIEQENTGTREQFASRLGISPRWLTQHIRKLEEVLNLPVNYSRKRQTYYFEYRDQPKLPPIYRIILNYTQTVRGSVSILNGLIFGY
jgi:transcriptional antiterminator